MVRETLFSSPALHFRGVTQNATKEEWHKTSGAFTFDAVRGDSRCPVGVSCIWAGDAVVAITVHDTDDGTMTLELHTNVRFDTEAVLDGHAVRLVELSPTPQAGSTIDVEQYEATLVINRRAA